MTGIFAPEVELLADSLEVLDLFDNTFLLTEGDAGNEWMGKMTNLRELFFGRTSFQYPGVPTFIGNMVALEEIDLSYSLFSLGPVPEEAFAGLENLSFIDMAGNMYTGTMPSSVTNLPNLEFFYIGNSDWSNGITLDFLVGMPAIIETWMDFTDFEGGLPTGLGNLSTLVSLSLISCSLTGTIPTELGNLTIQRMWLANNTLTGMIPTELGALKPPDTLDFSGNQLSGTMPSEICALRSPLSRLTFLGSDCDEGNLFFVDCDCCSCCGIEQCGF